jgi:hypothetical protein
LIGVQPSAGKRATRSAAPAGGDFADGALSGRMRQFPG